MEAVHHVFRMLALICVAFPLISESGDELAIVRLNSRRILNVEGRYLDLEWEIYDSVRTS